jgi:hypothetical protein
MVTWLGTVKKAVGSLLVGTLAWGTAVVDSAPAHITASEWIVLAGVGVSTLTVYFLGNSTP